MAYEIMWLMHLPPFVFCFMFYAFFNFFLPAPIVLCCIVCLLVHRREDKRKGGGRGGGTW